MTRARWRALALRGALALSVLFGCVGCLIQTGTGPGNSEGARRAAAEATGATPAPSQAPALLPPEAIDTLALIRRGGPYPHPQDDGIFFNREGLLPPQARGYYREYTVETPGLGHRGARRIVTGGHPPRSYYYTDDHYGSFHEFQPSP